LNKRNTQERLCVGGLYVSEGEVPPVSCHKSTEIV